MSRTIKIIPLTTALSLYLNAGIGFCANEEPKDLLSMSMEELMDVEVFSVNKNNQPLSTTAAPVFVITADDIRRSGAANIPEALRMAPGIQVSQIDPHNWAITIRGFNDVLTNKLLVMVDGRSIYSGFNSGTYWRDTQGMPLEDIERIEIVRGPGGTIWGANAVNGVINIITRSALADTGDSGKLTGGGGSEQRGFSRFSYTKKLNDSAHVRAYGSYFDVSGAKGPDDFYGGGADGWTTGARFDWDDKQNDALMIDAGWYENALDTTNTVTTLTPPYSEQLNNRAFSEQGGHFLSRWEHHINPQNHWALRAYYDYVNRDNPLLNIRTDTFDIDFTHYFAFGERHKITWGSGYRRVNDDIGNTVTLSVNPAEGHVDIYNAFAQDEISLDDDQNWHFTLGSKFEYYSLTQFEVEPSASLSWRITDQHLLWASVSHAVRTPARSQSDISALLFEGMLNPAIPIFAQGQGKQGIDAENATAYQLGWRGAFSSDFTADLTAFYTEYDDITRLETSGNATIDNRLGFPAVIIPVQVENNLKAQSYGAELSVSYQATAWWRNYLSYSFFKLDEQPYPGRELLSPDGDERSAPQQQVSLRTNFDVSDTVDLDLWWRYTDAITVNGRDISSYVNLDARVAWRPVKQLELSLVGQNLIQNHHLEFQQDFLLPQSTYVTRGVYAKVDWQF